MRLIYRAMKPGCVIPKKRGRLQPRKENGKARTWMDERSVRKSHGQHIPPAKGMDERALLLLGLLGLLTAADEVRHADAQHRATSDPSEGHAVETGEREVGALLIGDGEVHHAGGRFFLPHEIQIGSANNIAGRLHRFRLICRKRISANRKLNALAAMGVVVTGRSSFLGKNVSALIETEDVNFAVGISLEDGFLRLVRRGTVCLYVLVGPVFLQQKLNVRQTIIRFVGADLGNIDAISVVISRMFDRATDTIAIRVVGVLQFDRVLLRHAEDILVLLLDRAIILIADNIRIKHGLILNGHPRIS